MALQTRGIVIRNERIKSLYFLLEMDCPPVATEIKPGQFVMLKTSKGDDPLLRRPFSVFKSYPAHHPDKSKRGHFCILYKKVGKGTQKMTEFKKGQEVDLIGPLGNGFTLPPLPSSSLAILVGGGMGIVSLYSLAEVLGPERLFVFIGGKTSEDILCVEEFNQRNAKVFVATEDGSLGFRGTVTDVFSSHGKEFETNETGYLYACGPFGMLKALAGRVAFKPYLFQVSLEARMGCGFGACWGCVVKTNHPTVPYHRVCKEGPVFTSKDIDWESS